MKLHVIEVATVVIAALCHNQQQLTSVIDLDPEGLDPFVRRVRDDPLATRLVFGGDFVRRCEVGGYGARHLCPAQHDVVA